ncbi:MAG TPA: hypothetical protein VGH03_11340 [Caulobacteraceae bacterium]|jgi:hypothetical protein
MNARNSLFEDHSFSAEVHGANRFSLRVLPSTLIHRVTGVIKADPLVLFIGICNVIFYLGVILFLVHL